MAALPELSDPARHGLDAERLARLDAALARYVDGGKLPGWSVALTRHDELVHAGYGGCRDVEAGLPVEADTVFRIYSMTKPITSVAAMVLWERGLFELRDPVSNVLPEFADVRVFDGGSDLKPVTVPAVEPVRMWHLLTHTSGLTYGFHRAHPVDAQYRAAGFDFGTDPEVADLAGVSELLAGMPLLFQPGSEWNYSMSTDVLGRVVEVLSGRPLDQALDELVLRPLGMDETWFAVPEAARDRFAALYVPTPGPGLSRQDAVGASFLEPGWFSGGGGLSSTLGDYVRFTRFLARGGLSSTLGDYVRFTRFLARGGELDGVRLLGDRTLRLMAANHLPGGQDLRHFGRPLFAESPFDGVGFGLGFSVVLDPVATRTAGSVGEFAWGGAASTAFWVDPVEDLTVVFMTQLLPSSTYPLRSQLRQLVYSALVDRG